MWLINIINAYVFMINFKNNIVIYVIKSPLLGDGDILSPPPAKQGIIVLLHIPKKVTLFIVSWKLPKSEWLKPPSPDSSDPTWNVSG